jgi:hypothetical protein
LKGEAAFIAWCRSKPLKRSAGSVDATRCGAEAALRAAGFPAWAPDRTGAATHTDTATNAAAHRADWIVNWRSRITNLLESRGATCLC